MNRKLFVFLLAFAMSSCILCGNVINGYSPKKDPKSSHKGKYVCYKKTKVNSFFEYANKGNEFVEWESEKVPATNSNGRVRAVVACSFGVNNGTDAVHELYVNNKKLLDLKPEYKKEMHWAGSGAKVDFHTLYLDKNYDIFGIMYIDLPAKLAPAGDTLRFKVAGKKSKSKSWFMLAGTQVEDKPDIAGYQRANNVEKQLSGIVKALKNPADTSRWTLENIDAHPKYIPSAHSQKMTGQTKQLYNNWQELKKRGLSLLPVPKKISFSGKPIDTANIVIVLKNQTKQGKIAANEIVSRIKTLSGKTVPIVSAPETGKYNVIIENTFPNFFTRNHEKSVDTVNPYCRNQAYGLEAVRDGIKLAGNTPVGMMYAAVTLRWLIEAKDGKTLLYPANVIDWPDFPRRMLIRLSVVSRELIKYLGNDTPQAYIDFQKHIIEWAFRRKINMIFRHTSGIYHPTPFDREKWLKSKASRFERGKPLGDFLKERGMGAWDYETMNFGTVKQLRNHPELKDCGKAPLRRGLSYTSWAYDNLHQARAEKITEFLTRCGYTSAYIHDHDNIKAWESRDKATRKKYGNDRVAACIGMLNIYYKEFKKKNLEFGIVLLPYHGYNFFAESLAARQVLLTGADPAMLQAKLPAFEQQARDHSKFIKQVTAAFPDDVLVCVREATRREMLNFYSLCQGHPMFIYFQSFAPDDGENTRFLPATIATFKTAYDAGRKKNDLFAYMVNGYNPNISACAAEYAWNTEFPGCNEAMRGFSKSTFALGVNDPALLKIMAERAAVGVWGDKYGQVLKNMMDDDLSLDYPFFNRSFKGNKHENYLKNIQANKQFLEKAEKALDQAWEMDIQAQRTGRGSMERGYFYEYFLALRNAVKIAEIFNMVNVACLQATELADRGENAKAVKEIDNALQRLPAMVRDYEKIKQQMRGKFSPGFRYRCYALHRIIKAGLLKEKEIVRLRGKLEKVKKEIAFNAMTENTAAKASQEFSMKITDKKIKTVTVTNGTGTFISFKLSVACPDPANDLKITAALFSQSGKHLCAPFEIFHAKIPIRNKQMEVEKEIYTQQDIVKVTLFAQYRTADGKLKSASKEFSLGEDAFAKLGAQKGELVWLDGFENPDVLKLCKPFRMVEVSTTDKMASEGKHALQVSISPLSEKGGGVIIKSLKEDWSGYRAIMFDVYADKRWRIYFRPSSKDHKKDYISFIVKPGWNKNITIDFGKEIKNVDLKHIKDVLFYNGHSRIAGNTILIDNIRLIQRDHIIKSF